MAAPEGSSTVKIEPKEPKYSPYLEQIKKFCLEYMKMGVPWKSIQDHMKKVIISYQKYLTEDDIIAINAYLIKLQKHPPKVTTTETILTKASEEKAMRDFEKSFISDPETYEMRRNAITKKKIIVEESNFRNYFREAFGIPTSVYLYPLIWADYQVVEINSLYEEIKRFLLPEEQISVRNELDNLIMDKYKTFMHFFAGIVTNAFKGKYKRSAAFSFTSPSTSEFFTTNEMFLGMEMSHASAFIHKLKFIVLGARKKIMPDGRIKYYPPIMINDDWNDSSHLKMTEWFENMLTTNFRPLISWLDDTKEKYKESLADVPYWEYFLSLPEFKFQFADMPWYFIVSELHDGSYYPPRIDDGMLAWKMAYHEFEVYLAILYNFDLAMELVMHHEFLHHIEWCYCRIADIYQLLDTNPEKYTAEEKEKLIKYRGLYEEAMTQYFIHPDDPTKTIRYRGITRSIQSVYLELIEYYKIKYPWRSNYLKRFEGHDYSFVKAVSLFKSDKGNCYDALSTKGQMIYYFKVMFYKLYDKAFQTGAWLTCSVNEDEVIPLKLSDSDKF